MIPSPTATGALAAAHDGIRARIGALYPRRPRGESVTSRARAQTEGERSRGCVHEAWLRSVSDTPANVEVRAALLEGGVTVLGPPQAFVAATPPGLNSSIFVVGPADMALLRQAAQADPEAEVIASAATVASWAALPAGARRAVIHELPGALENVAPHPSLLLQASDAARLASVPDAELRAELEEAIQAGPLAIALAGEALAAFCYAGSVTETLWDISIDTLPAYRRRGLAGAAVASLAELHAAAGRRPIWGAEVSNAGSMGLAARLGFRPVDEVWLWRAADLLR
ncbi:MAG: GNAT family N-acetyltransferase [Polyangiaceae bacterium]